MSDADANAAEDLIAHLSGGLAPADRAAFRQAAEAALASSPDCWGPGSIHRALVPLWRQFFHPVRDDRASRWDQGRKPNKLVELGPDEYARSRRRLRVVG